MLRLSNSKMVIGYPYVVIAYILPTCVYNVPYYFSPTKLIEATPIVLRFPIYCNNCFITTNGAAQVEH